MTRIVGGLARGRQLQVPASGTRPTSDRAREALFSSLESMLELPGARVLDLFAGTGAVGLEALSRSAASAVLVDSGREAAQALRRNVESVALAGAHTRLVTVEAYLSATPSDGPFDLVFADPPYAYGSDELASVLTQLCSSTEWLAHDAVVVVERAARNAEAPWPNVIVPIKNRRYGDSVLWYGRRE